MFVPTLRPYAASIDESRKMEICLNLARQKVDSPTQDSNLQSSDSKSDALTIRPAGPHISYSVPLFWEDIIQNFVLVLTSIATATEMMQLGLYNINLVQTS